MSPIEHYLAYISSVKIATIRKELLDDMDGEPFKYYVVKTMIVMRVIFDKLFSEYDDDERFDFKYGKELLPEALNK